MSNVQIGECIAKFVNEILKGYFTEEQNNILGEIKIEVGQNDNHSDSVVTPDIESGSASSETEGCVQKTIDIKQVKLTYHIPEILSDLTDIYLFAVKLIIQSEEQLSKGYVSYIDKIVKDGDICTEFCKLLNADTLMNMYAKDYFEKKDLPSNVLMVILAGERYEKNESYAKIIFEKGDTENSYCFDKKYKFIEDNIRLIRKLMEITGNSDIALVARLNNEDNIWYIEGLTNSYQGKCMIEFEGNLSWSLWENNEKILKYYKGRYILAAGKHREKQEGVDDIISALHGNIVKNLISMLKKQKHGTAAIIMPKKIIREEVDRLCEQNKGIKVKEFDFISKHPIEMTNIDGAIFVDDKGWCYAIGVIVDGPTVIKGNPERGARYNSIKNYIAWKTQEGYKDIVGVIVSEDEMINVIKYENGKIEEYNY